MGGALKLVALAMFCRFAPDTYMVYSIFSCRDWAACGQTFSCLQLDARISSDLAPNVRLR